MASESFIRGSGRESSTLSSFTPTRGAPALAFTPWRARGMAIAAALGVWMLVATPIAHAQLEDELKNMEWVGFQQFQDSSRVFVRTTEPVKYTIERPLPDVIVLVLENTRIALANNTNHLDTRYFPGPVVFVQAKPIEGPSPSVRVEIRVRRQVPFKEFQNDTLLALDFPRD